MDGIRRLGGQVGDQLSRAAGQAGRAAQDAMGRVSWPWEGEDPDDGDLLDPLALGAHDAELAALDAAAQEEAIAHLAVLAGGEPVASVAATAEGGHRETARGAVDDDDGDAAVAQLVAMLAALHPAPPLPRSGPFTAGLSALLRDLQAHTEGGPLQDDRVAWVLDRVASRLTITVDDDGIEIVGILRRRRTPWSRIDRLTTVDRYVLLRDHLIGGTVEQAVAAGPLTVPGLAWLLERVLLVLEKLLPRRWRETARTEGGMAVAGVGRRRGRDVELGGPLALIAFLSEGLTAVLLDEATRRGIPIHEA